MSVTATRQSWHLVFSFLTDVMTITPQKSSEAMAVVGDYLRFDTQSLGWIRLANRKRPVLIVLATGRGAMDAFKICRATRGQGRTHGDQRTWWRGLRVADRRKTSSLIEHSEFKRAKFQQAFL